MKIIYFYEAFDGKLFDDENNCEIYETRHLHPNLSDIIFFNKEGKSYFINYNCPFNDNIYYDCEHIYIPTDAFDDFKWLVKTCGWCEFEQITAPGKWKRIVPEGQIDGKWIQIKK